MQIIHRRHLAASIACLAACFTCASHAQTTATQAAPAQATIETPATETIPVVPLPDPNGYDFYVRAGQALKTENPGPPSAAPSKDAATDLALQRAYVAKNAETLRLLREGLRHLARQPASRTNDDITKSFPVQKQFREMARLLVQESRVRLADGDFNGAADSLLDGIQLGIDIVRGGPLMASLVGGAVESIPRAEMSKLVKNLDAAGAQRAAGRLQEIEARRVPLAAVLEEEKWFGLSLLNETLASPYWANVRAAKTPDQITAIFGAPEAGEGTSDSEKAEEAKSIAMLQKTSDAQIKENYLGFMNVVVANARLPYNASPPAPPLPADALSRAYTGDIMARPDTRVIADSAVAANRLLIVALALRAHQAEHGAFPATLKELAPQTLAQVPADLFSSTNAPLGYKREKDGYVLYSVGPDGIDDDAKAIPDASRITAQSKGDIVAGINR